MQRSGQLRSKLVSLGPKLEQVRRTFAKLGRKLVGCWQTLVRRWQKLTSLGQARTMLARCWPHLAESPPIDLLRDPVYLCTSRGACLTACAHSLSGWARTSRASIDIVDAARQDRSRYGTPGPPGGRKLAKIRDYGISAKVGASRKSAMPNSIKSHVLPTPQYFDEHKPLHEPSSSLYLAPTPTIGHV